MENVIIGIGGVTNGGKTTLSQSLQGLLQNTCVISQDNYFKNDLEVSVDIRGFKEYDTLDALHMDRMMADIHLWQEDPERFMKTRSLNSTASRNVFVLVVEGFLIFNHRPLNDLFSKRYFLQIPYEACRERRSSRVYVPPDPPGYFDGYVWPMYLKNRKVMEETLQEMVFLDGTQKQELLVSSVLTDIQEMLLVTDE